MLKTKIVLIGKSIMLAKCIDVVLKDFKKYLLLQMIKILKKYRKKYILFKLIK